VIDDLWYKNGVIYCLSVGTYMDANEDGVGDFKGLLRRLDYLHGLGITAIWLMPFQPSPMRDDGYDISDYYGVDPRYGTLGDFVEFTHGCKQRGIRVIIDLVVNHTSDQHPWFKEARKSKDSPYRDWYVWSDKKPANANTGMVFPGVQKSTWSRDKESGAWYFHRFYDFQPDLNTSNPHVQAEILKIMGFWIQLGVSGFRMDAVPFVIATKGPKARKPVEQYDMLRSFREFLQWLAMGDNLDLPERTCARTPMQWSTACRLHRERQALRARDRPGSLRLRARQRRQAASRSELDAELDRAHHPHAQGGPGSWLGRLQGDRDARSGSVRDPLRLAQQFGAVRAQSRRQAARGQF